MRRFVFIPAVLGLLLIGREETARGQERIQPLANAGPTTIFVSLGRHIPLSESNTLKGYAVERRTARSSAWQSLAEVTAPAAESLFVAALDDASRLLPHLSAPPPDRIAKIWQRAAHTGRLDSLGFWGSTPLVQIALGCMYHDTSPTAGTEYEYRVSQLAVDGKMARSVRSNTVRVPGIPQLSGLRSGDASVVQTGVTLQWKSPGNNLPAALLLFREENGSGTFDRIHATFGFQQTKDTLIAFAWDTMASGALVRRYYAVPMDVFGNQGARSDTVTVGAYGFASAAAVAGLQTESMDSLGGIRISWALNDPRLARSIQVHRATQWDGPYTQIAEVPTGDIEYLDQSVHPMKEYFYRILAVGLLGEAAEPSARVYGLFQSSEPPAAPTQVDGKGIKGGVRLEWVNTDEDVAGFYVYRAGGGSDSLELLTPLIPRKAVRSHYVDTSRALSGTQAYAYAIRSENTSHVLSGFSDTVYARPLIPTRPAGPMDITISTGEGTARIFWQDMASIDGNIEGYFVLRREIPSGKNRPTDFARLSDSLITVNYVEDSTLQEGKTYEYALQSIDLFGGTSEYARSGPVTIALTPPPSPAGLRASASPGGAPSLRWDPPSSESLKGYRVFRYERGKKATRIGDVKPTSRTYTDASAQKGKLYFYYVTSVSARGIESPPSGEVGARR